MTDRELFLGRLRNRLFGEAHANVAHPVQPLDAVPALRYARPLDDPVASFEKAAQEAGATVARVEDGAALATLVGDVVAACGARSVVLSHDPETEAVGPILADLGVEVVAYATPLGPASCDLGITGAAWGIAATGTIVMHPGRAGGRSASLLPPAHLALVRAESILPDAGELFRRMPERFPGGLPSQLVLATGPSRTGDIELTLTTKVHGPGDVWIGILG